MQKRKKNNAYISKDIILELWNDMIWYSETPSVFTMEILREL